MAHDPLAAMVEGTARPLGVGLIGAGLAAQSIHVPIVARFPEKFAIKAIWDVDHARAEQLSERVGATSAANLADLLANDQLDVIVICSPARFHAEHAIAAMRAGRRAVLVEKPLCNSVAELEAIASAAAETRAVVMTGSMHLHDPAWREADRIRRERSFAAHRISSRILLPPNARFEPWAFEPIGHQPAAGSAPQWTSRDLMRMGIMELAIHDLPLVRRLLPRGAVPRVASARLLQPFGYLLNVEAGGVLLELLGLAHGLWHTEWSLEATGSDARLELSFTPSFVHAGSGRTTWRESEVAIAHQPSADNGYVHEWLDLARVLSGTLPAPDVNELVLDYRFACALADQACSLLGAGDGR